jgi:hypothetical protein
MSLASFFSSIKPGVSTPSLSTTYGRWSAAESPNGGLNAAGDWVSVDNKTLSHNGNLFTYDPTGLNGKPTLVAPSGGANGSFYIANLALPNSSAATIVVMVTPTNDVQVVSEYSENVNSTPNTFANYIESYNVEAYLDIASNKDLYSISQPAVNTPMLISSRFYTSPRRTTLKVNAGDAQNSYGNPTTSNTNFGTQNLYVFSRSNFQYYTKGKLAVYHLFHTAPSDTEWNDWITYYKNLYQLP